MPQPGAERRLDSQGDKIMSRLVYRRLGDHESILANPFDRDSFRAAAAYAGTSSV